MSRMEVDLEGNKFYYNEQDQLHREDGPAIEWKDGTKFWYFNNKKHRVNGPAIEYADGGKYWYMNGQRHRVDGPAIEWENDKYWYIEGQEHTEEEFYVEIAKRH